MNKEISRLENLASDSWYAAGVNLYMIKYSFEILKKYLKGIVL